MAESASKNKNRINPKFIVAAGTLIMLLLGVAYVWGVYVDPLMEEFGWSSARASWPFSVFLLAYTVGMIVGGRLQDIYGPRPICLIGAVLFGAGYFLSGLATNLIFLCITYGVIGGFGTGFAYVTPVSTVVKWFPERKGLMSGIVIFGFGAGSFIFSPLVSWIIQNFSWQIAFYSLGVLFLVLTVGSSFFMILPSDGEEEETSEESHAVRDYTPFEMLKTPGFWLAWIGWFFALSVGLGVMGHVVNYAIGTGVIAFWAAFILSIVAVFNGLGRVLTGAISDKVGGLLMLALSCFGMGLSALLFYFSAGNLWMFYTIAILFGFSFGALLVLYPVITAELFGVEHMGANYGILFSSYGIGGFVGPVVFGQLHDLTTSYSPALLLSTVLCAVAAGLIIILRNIRENVS